MSRKLWLLNILLLALTVFAGSQLRTRWMAAKAREAAAAHRTVPPIPPPPFTAAPAPPATTPGTYAAIAQQDLFDRSRNPDVPVEKVAPPPKPPMPPLPVYYGAMNFPGEGPMVIMGASPSAPQEDIRPGQMIGPFKLVDVTRQDLTLEWNGEMVRKSLDEFRNHGGGGAPAPVQDAAAARPAAAAPVARVEPPSPKGPGADGLGGSKLCVQNDSTPYGAVQDGYRKTEIKTPFGSACLWDPVK